MAHPGIFLVYFVREILVALTYEDYKTNYPTKDEEIINRALIVPLADMGFDMEKTKDGPFHKYFDFDMTFCGILCIISLGGLHFGCMPNRPPRLRMGDMHYLSSIISFYFFIMSLTLPPNLISSFVSSPMMRIREASPSIIL